MPDIGDISEFLKKLRQEQRTDGPLDMEQIAGLNFHQLVTVRNALRQDAEEIFGSDWADQVSDALAKHRLNEAAIIDSLINSIISRTKLMAIQATNSANAMEAEALPQIGMGEEDLEVRVSFYVKLANEPSKKELGGFPQARDEREACYVVCDYLQSCDWPGQYSIVNTVWQEDTGTDPSESAPVES